MTDTSHIPYRYLQDPALYRVEQQRIFQGPTWHYLCLEAEIPAPGDFRTTLLGETPIGHYLFNCQAPDVGNQELLLSHGTPEQRAR